MPIECLWDGRLLGGVCIEFFPRLLETVFLRCAGIENELSPTSRATAANAAMFAVFWDTLFRRVTRWFGFNEPEIELLFLVWDLAPNDPEFDMEGR